MLRSQIMKKLQLVVGGRSTWSMRAWMSLKLAELEFEVLAIPLGRKGSAQMLMRVSDTRLVPVLIHNQLRIHDSLAIAEYVNEISPRTIFPKTIQERAIARSLCAELHSGFYALRENCAFHLGEAKTITRSHALETEVNRLTNLWHAAQGDFYFEQASVVDAFYAVMAYRLASYGIRLAGNAGAYQDRLVSWPIFQEALGQTRQWDEAV